ncbi:MAG: hypothetical protein HOY71_35580 [Nonomuraea sp.]|nr:hypothetical protein [Nonomuraea sp.]
MKAALVVAAFLAAIWVVLPASPQETGFPAPAATAVRLPEPRELKGPAPSPVRYASTPSCEEEPFVCEPWVLVSAAGDRWRLPGATGDEPLALSQDGTRAAYRDSTEGHFVVADLRRGKTTILRMESEEPPLFSPDGRYLLVRTDQPRHPVVVNVDRGTMRELDVPADVAGWTREGLVVRSRHPAGDLPGHLATLTYTVYSPAGRRIRAFTLPGNLTGSVSPSGRLMALAPVEFTPLDEVARHVSLVDTATGRQAGTVAVAVEEIVRWEGENELVVRVAGPDPYRLLDLATGRTTSLGVRMAPAEGSVVIGATQ